MQSRRRNSNSKTRERKVEAMRQLKEAYDTAKAAGTVKSYKIVSQN